MINFSKSLPEPSVGKRNSYTYMRALNYFGMDSIRACGRVHMQIAIYMLTEPSKQKYLFRLASVRSRATVLFELRTKIRLFPWLSHLASTICVRKACMFYVNLILPRQQKQQNSKTEGTVFRPEKNLKKTDCEVNGKENTAGICNDGRNFLRSVGFLLSARITVWLFVSVLSL